MAIKNHSVSQKQFAAWQVAGHEFIHERGVPRLAKYRKEFPADQVVQRRNPKTFEVEPFRLDNGAELKIGECFPERVDLCLDESGVMLQQHEFVDRYHEMLSSFLTPPDFDVSSEPVPNVESYLNAKHDIWGESRGYVKIDYDGPKDTKATFKPEYLLDENGDIISIEEFREANEKRGAQVDQMQELLIALGQKVLDAPEAAPEVEGITAPCGKDGVKNLGAHQRWCKDPACNTEDEAA